MSTLTPSQVASIIGVRELLTEASRRVGDRSVGGRHAAVVLLDAAVEAAVAVCLGEHGDAPTERDSLADIHQRLRKHLGTQTIAGWRDANRLRRARNLAQHHQVPVDSETLVSLYPPVSSYVEDIIRTTFGVRTSDVVLATAIENDDVRTSLQAVETAIDVGDVQTAMSTLQREFRRVREWWSSSTFDLPGRARQRGNDEFGLGRAIEDQTADLRDLVEVWPFAADPAEYVWFRRAVSSAGSMGSTTATEDDARRALQFVVSWTTRWEAYSRTHRELTERERQARRIIASPSGRPGGRPEWTEPPAIRVTRNRVDISGSLAWGEDNDGAERADAWVEALRRGLGRALPGSDRTFQLSAGRLSATWSVHDNIDPDLASARVGELMEQIRAAFERSSAELTVVLAERAAVEAERRRCQETADQVLISVRSATGADASPFVSAALDGHGREKLCLYVKPGLMLPAGWHAEQSGELGHWLVSGRGLAWAIPLDAQMDDVVTAAARRALQLLDEAERAETERTTAQTLQSAAEAIVAERWRD